MKRQAVNGFELAVILSKSFNLDHGASPLYGNTERSAIVRLIL
jgi:hypothetical protein